MNSSLDPNQQAALKTMAAVGPIFFIICIVFLILSVVIYWRIVAKAGYPGAASLLMFIPFVNLIMVVVFAFAEWPVEKRAKLATGIGGPPATY